MRSLAISICTSTFLAMPTTQNGNGHQLYLENFHWYFLLDDHTMMQNGYEPHAWSEGLAKGTAYNQNTKVHS